MGTAHTRLYVLEKKRSFRRETKPGMENNMQFKVVELLVHEG